MDCTTPMTLQVHLLHRDAPVTVHPHNDLATIHVDLTGDKAADYRQTLQITGQKDRLRRLLIKAMVQLDGALDAEAVEAQARTEIHSVLDTAVAS